MMEENCEKEVIFSAKVAIVVEVQTGGSGEYG
jgi:hypothetical protein